MLTPNEHMKTIHGERLHPCKQQMKTIHGEKHYTCEACEIGFNQLNNTKEIHIDNSWRKQYTCGACEKGFKLQDNSKWAHEDNTQRKAHRRNENKIAAIFDHL